MEEHPLISNPPPRRRRLHRIYLCDASLEDAVYGVLGEPGEELKCSEKSGTYRVRDWVLKCLRGNFLTRLVKLTFRSARYRRGWDAACFLRQRGVCVPTPVAYVETGILGLIWRNAFFSDYLAGQQSVEEFLQMQLRRGGKPEIVACFLKDLADAVNSLTETGAYHSDLSGKNIFTLDGHTFCFIDLDAVVLGEPYDDARRLKNHVQLYDSFCDMLNDTVLVPFIERMLTDAQDPRIWMPAVRKGQHARRMLVEERWAKEGKPSKHLTE